MFVRTESFKQFIRFYPVVSLIVFLNIILYILTVLPIFPNSYFLQMFAGVNIYIREGEIWRLLTPIFLHNNFMHMLFNSFSIVLFAPSLERMLGKWRFLLVYIGTGIFANLATLLLKPATYVHVGSSGAIFGLFGFYLSILLLRKYVISRNNSQFLVMIIAISFIMTFLQPNINVTAHFFGLISGFLFGVLFFREGKNMINLLQSQAKNWSGSKTGSKTAPSILLIIIIILAILGLLSR
ncbi:rhomboid family intramembrane serine protease [Bacillaceae bacterium Marseille-Q3522]|nr:rhomboid family intramembrane serine protease [Bacillaceae bacterium Marseille-Q3522]